MPSQGWCFGLYPAPVRTERLTHPFLILFSAGLFALSVGCGSSATGSSTVTSGPASPAASHAKRASASSASADWPTYHADQARSGVDSTSPTLSSLHLAWSHHVDGAVYAEPLALGQRVYVATENASVYALSAASGRVIWHRHLGSAQSAASLPCGNISPVAGLTGTPVISTAKQTIYAVAFLSGERHVLFALKLRNGRERFQRRVDAPGSSSSAQQERAALSLANGRVYVPFGGLYGDCGPYKGRVVGVSERRSGARKSFTVGVGREGGIWAPSGAAVDSGGQIFVATGNGTSGGFDYGNSVIRLSPTLKQTGYFRPTNGGALNTSDTDVGSVGPTLLSGDRLFQIGKEGVGYIVSTTQLGGVGGQLGSRQVCSSAFGGMAYQDPYVYLPCTDGLVAVRVGAGGSFSVAWRGPGFTAGPPILAGGAVWTIDTDSGTLHAYNPTNGGSIAHIALGSVTNFATPSAGGGMLFAPAEDRVVAFSGV